MEAERFDRISRDVGARRRLLTALFAGAVSGALALTQPAGGKGKNGKKGKRKKKGHCESDWACPVGELCKGGRCKPGCDTRRKDDCPEGMACNMVFQQCFQRCEVAGYQGPNPTPPLCPGGQTCHFGGVCGPLCSSDADCCYPGAYDCSCLTDYGSCV
jgi:hypothetical protein